MKKKYILTTIISLLFVFCLAFTAKSQSNATIENVDFYSDGTNLIITYDIMNSFPGEIFDIWLKISTSQGMEIKAYNLTGDIGNNVNGGPGKTIVWDYSADNINLDDEIEVEVYAKVRTTDKPKIEKEPEQVPVKPVTTGDARKVSVGKAMALSLVLPGLGNRYIKGGGGQFVWGILGYTCLAGSVFTNGAAANKLDEYRITYDTETRDKLYKDAENLDLTSKVLVGAAATIWVLDLIITGVQAGKANKKYKQSKVHLFMDYQPEFNAPAVGLTLKF